MTAFYNEIEPYAADWLENLIAAGEIPAGVVDRRSIEDITPDELRPFTQCHFFAGIGVWPLALRRAGVPDDFPVWTGSCPCQPFSAAGARGGTDDERHLWPHWHHLIGECRPAIVFGEQVASKDGLHWLDLVQADLEGEGYASGAADLCAPGVGGSHIRQRLYFVGVDNSPGARHAGAVANAETEARGEARLRVSDSGRVDGGLAYADGGERPERNDGMAGGSDERANPARGVGGVADESTGGRRQGGAFPSGSRGRNCSEGSAPGLGERGGNRGLADAHGEQREQGLQPVSGGFPERVGGGGVDSGLGHADDAGLQKHGRPGNVHIREQARPDSGRLGIDPSVSVGASRGAPTFAVGREPMDLLYCRDGKWRPVEPGTFPLAYAAPRSMGTAGTGLQQLFALANFDSVDLAAAKRYRIGTLKGYGNGLDAATAQLFVESALEALGL